MAERIRRRFQFKHDKAWAWHIGVFFCVEPKDETGQRDIYLLFCIGTHDFSIGWLSDYEEVNDLG